MPELIQFTTPEQLRFFAAHSREAGSVQVSAREWGQSPFLHVQHDGPVSDRPVRLGFAIPLRAVDGHVDAILLTVLGDGCKAIVSLTCRTARGPEFEIRFPPIDFTDRRTMAAALPVESAPELGFLHIERLNIQLPAGVERASLGLFSLAVLGTCRVVSPSIA